MTGTHQPGHLVFGIILLVTLFAAAGVVCIPGQRVTVEKSPVFIPAGPGKKPFNATRHIIPLNQIASGGVSRDQIPALFRPKFASAGQAGTLLRDSERVLGVFLDGQAKAYPVCILNYHELINDTVGRRPVLVSW